MEKPILATTLSGLFIKHEPWQNAHLLWFAEREKELKAKKKDVSAIEEWRRLLETNPEEERKSYFKYVDKVMQVLYPKRKESERTALARKSFFDSICKYIKLHPETKNAEVIKYFQRLRKKYSLALITANTKDAVARILQSIGLTDFFDLIETSLPDEKDDKVVVFDRFRKKYRNPLVYIGGDRKDSFDYCHKHNIPAIYTNFEKGQELEGVKTAHNLEELTKELELILSN